MGPIPPGWLEMVQEETRPVAWSLTHFGSVEAAATMGVKTTLPWAVQESAENAPASLVNDHAFKIYTGYIGYRYTARFQISQMDQMIIFHERPCSAVYCANSDDTAALHTLQIHASTSARTKLQIQIFAYLYGDHK